MKRYRPLMFFGIAVILGLVTSIMVFSWLQNEKNRLMAAPIPLTQNVQVVVANADFAWGTKLTPEMVQIQELPAGIVPEGHFTNVDAIKDRVVMVDIKRNELLIESKLAPVGATTGGVAASTAFLGDVNVAEPNALIGFAGPRVIKNTLKVSLPEGFQSSKFLLEHGMVDTVVPRSEFRSTLAILIRHLAGEHK